MQDPHHRSLTHFLALIENAISQLDEQIRKTADQSAVELNDAAGKSSLTERAWLYRGLAQQQRCQACV